MTVQVFIPSGARSRSALAKTINNLVTRKARVGHSELQTRSAHVCIYPMVSAMTSYSNFYVTAHVLFLGSKTRAQFMLNSWRAREVLMCLLIVCETVFTIGESRAVSMQMTQDSKLNKWLEILAGEDFPPKLLWRTSTKIHRERRTRRQHC